MMDFKIGYCYSLNEMPKAITNFAIHENLFKYWFTLRHFAMDDPAIHTYYIVTDGGYCYVLFSH